MKICWANLKTQFCVWEMALTVWDAHNSCQLKSVFRTMWSFLSNQSLNLKPTKYLAASYKIAHILRVTFQGAFLRQKSPSIYPDQNVNMNEEFWYSLYLCFQCDNLKPNKLMEQLSNLPCIFYDYNFPVYGMCTTVNRVLTCSYRLNDLK